MKRLLLLTVALFCAGISFAQLLTWNPPFPTENDPAQMLTITLDATKGNKALENFATGTDVYVHIGAITNKSTSFSDWKYVKFTWATTPVAANAPASGTNRWTYTINGSLRSFFGITDATESIQKIALLFRNGAGTTVHRNADGSDMYVPVYSPALAVRLTQPASEPKFIPTPEPQNWNVGTAVPVTAVANKPSAMKLYHNGAQIAASAGNVTSLSGNFNVSAVGNQQIIAEANDGSATRYDTINVFVAPPGGSPEAALPAGVRDGINYNSPTSVTLVLRAPGKNLVTVVGDFNNWVQTSSSIMNRAPGGKFFWITLNGLTPGQEYAFQYIVDNSIRIADPYSEKVLDPSNDQYISATTYPGIKPYPFGLATGVVGVFQTQAPAYTWTVNNFARPDKRGLVIYELLVRDFVAAHDWKTIQDSLNYLQRLGVNAIELMPFNEFEGNNSWGYNPNYYFTPDKYYGPPATLKRFIDSCHRRGIAVLMDIALNHQFGSSPMVQLYYDGAANRPATNNPWFNPVPKHAYNVGFDMNHESLETKYFVGRVVEHWLREYKIDGFRFDLSKGFTQKQTCDNNGGNCNEGAMAAYDLSRVNIWKAYYDSVQNKSANAYVILEHFAADNEEAELSNYGMLFWNNLNFAYSEGVKGNTGTSNFDRAIPSTHGFSQPHLVTYAESHDEERLMYRALNEGNTSNPSHNVRDTTVALKRSELAAVFLLTIPGPKMIWQFGELGYNYSINTCTDLTVNNNCRLAEKPIRWDYLNDPRRRNLFNVYSALNRLRFDPRYVGAFQTGTIDRSFGGAFKWLRLTTFGDTADVVVIGNFGVQPQTGDVVFPKAGVWYDYFGNFIHEANGGSQTFTLQPGEYHVYVSRNVNNVTPTPVTNVPWSGNTLEAKLYPNPLSTGKGYTVEVKMPQGSRTTMELYNSVGGFVRTVYSGNLVRGANTVTLPALSVSAGTYFLTLRTKDGNQTISFTLQ